MSVSRTKEKMATEQKYWDLGARRILADAVERNFDHIESRKEATRLLFKQFTELTKQYSLKVEIDKDNDDALCIHESHFKRAFIVIDVDGTLVLRRRNVAEKIIPLHFNPITKMLEGDEADPDFVPVPGEIIPRRSALSVLALIASSILEQEK